MAELLEFVNHEFTDFVEHGLTGIPTDELPALDTLREFMKHTLAGLSDGGSGGGSGRGSAGVPAHGLPVVVMLLEFLKQKFQESPDVPTELLAALGMFLELLEHKFQDLPMQALLKVGLADPGVPPSDAQSFGGRPSVTSPSGWTESSPSGEPEFGQHIGWKFPKRIVRNAPQAVRPPTRAARPTWRRG